MSGKVKTLDALTGLRFIAAFLVFVHHISGRFGLGEVRAALGALAVSFFFVLSGFILTYVYHNRLQTKDVKRFYFTRWARIWPLHVVCFLFALFMLNMPRFDADPIYGFKVLSGVFLLQSWVPDYGWNFVTNGVSWSISTEMFFYLMFPLFLLGGQKKFWIKYFSLLGAMLLLIPGVNMLSHTGWTTFDFKSIGHCNPLFRLPEFCTGMAIGFIYLNRSKLIDSNAKRNLWFDTTLEAIALASVVAYMIGVQKSGISQWLMKVEWGSVFLSSLFRFTSGCLVFAFVIYTFARTRGLFGKLFSTRLFVFLGEVSFAFYMVHQIVIKMVMRMARYFDGISPIVVATCVGLIALGFSVLLFKLVEMPCKNGLLALYDRKWKKAGNAIKDASWKFARSPLAAATLVLILVPYFTLAEFRSNSRPETGATEIVRATNEDMRGIEFGNSVKLLGYSVEPHRRGLEMKMVWEKKSDIERSRVVHICNDEGEVVAYGPRQEDLFHDAKIGSTFIDRVLLVDSKLVPGSKICVGFHGVGKGMLKVKTGPRSMRNRRLDLVSTTEYERVAQARFEQFGVRVSAKPDDNDSR